MDAQQPEVVGGSGLTRRFNLTRKQIIAVLICVAALGAIFLLRSFAADTLVGFVQGESMKLPSKPRGSQIISDASASNGQAMKLSWNQSGTNGAAIITGNVTLSGPANTVKVVVRGDACGSRRPYVTVTINNKTAIPQTRVTSSTWDTIKNTNYSLAQGTYPITVKGDNLGNSSCHSDLYVDVVNVYGASTAVEPPQVFLSASPTSVSSGGSSTLNWKTVNVKSCTTSGNWKPTITPNTTGSTSTGALSSTATYSLQCVGNDGTSTSGTATVTVAATPPPDDGGSTGGTPNTGMIVGLVSASAWGQTVANDTATIVKTVRLEDARESSISVWKNAGIKVDLLFSGNYNSSGVSGLGDATSWAKSKLSKYKSVGCDTTTCPIIEILNEPGGEWFWGGNALSSTNATAYANLLKASYDVFHNEYGDKAPKILATLDGSYHNGDPLQFGKGWWPKADHNKIDGIVVHPYGGKSSKTSSALGNHSLVTNANTYTGKPIYITEVGWPTAEGQKATGDSLQWTEAEQANNLYNFINWARDTGYVNAVMYFQYRDYISVNKTTGEKTYMWYGVTRDKENSLGAPGTKKKGWDALGCAAKSKTWNTTALTCN